jgi:Spy/CpxP family protein refolding chaperone
MKPMVICAALLAGPVLAATDTPYAGQQAQEIASLSEADVAALLAGEGWGLALPAELNGYPGPAHVLELAKELALTPEQVTQVEAIFAAMQAEAQALGADYVAAEKHLSQMFAMGHASPEMLDRLLQDSSAVLARLRAVHLKAHLQMTPLLTETQRAAYAELRGYGAEGDHGGHGAHGGHAGHGSN